MKLIVLLFKQLCSAIITLCAKMWTLGPVVYEIFLAVRSGCVHYKFNLKNKVGSKYINCATSQ